MASKVLLVEDDNNLREIYEARLQAEGYDIVTAKDGEEALVIAKTEKPDLIISDVMMPRISGFEMLDILRNTEGLRDTKVIMLTALGQADDKSRADKLGADRYLVKSQVTLEDIVKSAQDLLGGGTAVETPTADPAPAVDPVVPVAAPAPVMPDPAPVAAPDPTPVAPVAVDPVVPTAAVTDEVANKELITEALKGLMPDPAPVAAPDPTPVAPVAVDPVVPEEPAETKPALDEADVVEKQIEDFAKAPVAPAAVTDEPTPPTDTELPEAVPAVATVAAPAPVEEPETPPAPVDDSQIVAHKKIISPISSNSPPETNINDLLAKEGITNSPAPVTPEPAPVAPAPVVEAPNLSEPEEIDKEPHPPGHVVTPSPNDNSPIDPNSIAL
jgi:CheY-like chemotaxis protein